MTAHNEYLLLIIIIILLIVIWAYTKYKQYSNKTEDEKVKERLRGLGYD